MRSKVVKLSLFGLSMIAFGIYSFIGSNVKANSSGPPAARTGATLIGSVTAELNCTTSGCHTGTAVNTGGGTVAISPSSNTYTPNQEITITVTVTQTGRSTFGFQLTAVNPQGSRAGDLSPSGNAANSSGTNGGDLIYTTSLTIQPGSTVGPLGSFSAASYAQPALLTPDTIVAAYGVNLTPNTASNTPNQPLPTQLDGTEVKVKDANSVDRNAPLFFVSPGQINYIVPTDTSNGLATVTVRRSGNDIAQGTVNIERVSPGIFSQNSNGQGVAAAYLIRVKADNSQSLEFVFDPAIIPFVPKPINMGPATDRIFLVLFGTGFRLRSQLSNTTCTVGGIDLPVLYAGPSDFVGLDQANVELPRTLIGRGTVDVVFKADNKTANTVTIAVQ
ncbi:MAG: hypothetical protein IPG76_14260 [Acidobacteria bacterium]|nr:hypothetical protein [Acidobacteriota bacterium]